MRVSACVITKNEEFNLPRCLESVESIVSEIIVVDTGSVDNTIKVAESYGAKVYHFEWVNDFSKAKNFAISKAKGDWIIFLDADEYFTKKSTKFVPLVIKDAHKNGEEIIVSILTNYSKEKKAMMNSFPVIRIFKNHPSIRYEGAIHESLTEPGRPFKQLNAIKYIQIMHTGYSDSDVNEKDKAKRNLDLLFEELAKKPNNGNICFYISEAFMLGRKFEEALEYALRALEQETLTLPGAKQKNYLNVFDIMALLKYPRKEIGQKIKEAIAVIPNFPDFYLYLGLYLEQEFRYHDAIEAYELGIENLRHTLTSQSSAYLKLAELLGSLGELYYKIGSLEKSVKNYVEALKSDKYAFDSIKKLLMIFSKSEPVYEIFNFFKKIYDFSTIKDLIYLLKASLQVSHGLLAKSFFDMISEEYKNELRQEAAMIDMLTGNFEKAVPAFKQIYLDKPEEQTAINWFVAARLQNDPEVLNDTAWIEENPLRNTIEFLNGKHNRASDVNAYLTVIKTCIELSKLELLNTMQTTTAELKVLLNVGELLFASEYYQESLDYYDAFLKDEQDISERKLAEILIKMGICILRLDNPNLAIQFFEDAFNINAKDFRIYESIIPIYLTHNDVDKLSAVIEEALKYFPDSNYLKTVLKNCLTK